MCPSGGEVVAIRCVGSDHPLPAVAVCCSGSGLPAEESPEKEPHIFMKGADQDIQPFTTVKHRCKKFNF